MDSVNFTSSDDETTARDNETFDTVVNLELLDASTNPDYLQILQTSVHSLEHPEERIN